MRYGGPSPASNIAGTMTSKNGTPVLSTDQDALSGGFGPSLRRMITSGVYNGDFNDPTAAGGTISPDNPLPFWDFVQASGAAFEAYSQADGSTASGVSIRMALLAGAASDEGYLEQLIPVNGSQGRTFTYGVGATIQTGAVVNGIQASLKAQFLKEDGTTTTGSESTDNETTTSIGASTVTELLVMANASGVVPSDAYWLRVRIGLARAAAATSDMVAVTLHEVMVFTGGIRLIATDAVDPATYGHAAIKQESGVLQIRPRQTLGFSLSTHAYIEIDTVSGDLTMTSENSGGLQLASADATQHPYVEMRERTDPSAPTTNRGRLYVRDNGAGKTQLVVRFPTGAIQVLATEP